MDTTCGDKELLARFNMRDRDALGDVYILFYTELHSYADKLYHNTGVSSSDMIHDIFLSIFRSRLKFDSLEGIKAYVYVAIKNKFRDHLSHNSHVTDYRRAYLKDNDAFEIDIVEAEYYSTVQFALGLLPEDSARIFGLFLEGWNAEEISRMTGKSLQTVYNKKHEAVKILRRKLPPDKLLLLSIL